MSRDPKPRPARGPRTRAVHGDHGGTLGPVSTPIVHSATFSFPSLKAMDAEQDRAAAGAYYQRLGHPTLHACEERLAGLEGAGGALLFASGMAALSAMFLAPPEVRRSRGRAPSELRRHRTTCCTGARAIRLERRLRRRARSGRLGASVPARDAPAARRVAHQSHPVRGRSRARRQLAHAPWRAPHGGQHRRLADRPESALARRRPGHVQRHQVDRRAQRPARGCRGRDARGARRRCGRRARCSARCPIPRWRGEIERSLKTLPLRVAAANANALELARRLAEHPGVRARSIPACPRTPSTRSRRGRCRSASVPCSRSRCTAAPRPRSRW